MPSRFRDTALFAFALLIAPSLAIAGETVELFNGKDLKGWIKRGGDATYHVEKGEVVGNSAPNTSNTFLCTPKDYANFELEYDFKIDDTNFNSGVQIRSHARTERHEVHPAGYEVDEERVFGYQIEIDPKPRAWSGGLYFEGGSKDKEGHWIRKGEWLNDLSKNEPARKAFKLGEWNHIKVIANGRRIQTWINGVPAADFTDKDDKAFVPSGLIALQVHTVGPDVQTKEIRWRNIKLKELE